jgi:uncharacterized protein YegP (UPF0339 family)
MKPKFVITRSKKNRQFYFALKAPNGKTIAQSEGYKTQAGCERGIASVKKNASAAEIV